MERILEQIPRFFSGPNMTLLLEAAGLTLAMTLTGCLIGFGLAFVLVYLRQTPGMWALPLRWICITYVEVFRRIPFIVVIYLVLFLYTGGNARCLAVHNRCNCDMPLRRGIYR
jgi:polar amino acid transport system permease protein